MYGYLEHLNVGTPLRSLMSRHPVSLSLAEYMATHAKCAHSI